MEKALVAALRLVVVVAAEPVVVVEAVLLVVYVKIPFIHTILS